MLETLRHGTRSRATKPITSPCRRASRYPMSS